MSQGSKKSRRNRILSWIINLSGILVFGLILYLGGIKAWQQILRADWRYVLAAFAVTLAWNMVATYRWSLVAKKVVPGTEDCPYPYFFTYQMIGMLIGQVVPITVGMLGGRPVALSLSRGVSLKRSVLSVFLDKVFDLLLALMLIIPVVLFLVDVISLPQAFAAMGGILLFGLLAAGTKYEQGIGFLARTGSRLAQPLAHVPVIGQRLVRRLPQQLDRLTTEGSVPNRLAVQALLLTLVMYGLLSLRLFFIAQALGLEIPLYVMVIGACVTQLASILAVTPGSLGFLEAGWGAVFGLAGLSQEQYLFFVIGRRAFVLVFTLIQALLAFAWIRESPAYLFRAVIASSRQPAKEPAGSTQGG